MNTATKLSPAERQARAEARRSEIEQRLLAGVQAITDSDAFKAVLQANAKFHRYSLNNILLIMLQRPTATRVTGFSQWKAMGRNVKKGERGIMILAPRPSTRINATGNEETKLFFKAVFVFDESQTEGREIPDHQVPLLTEDTGHDVYGRLVAYAESQGITVTHTSHQAPDRAMGAYHPSRKEIFVRPAAQLQMLKTLVHELGHHHDDLANECEALETVAEGVAYVVCAHFGLDTSERSFPYIAAWTGQDGGTDLLTQVLTTIQQISKRLIDAASPTVTDEDDHAAPPAPATSVSRTRRPAAQAA